MGIGVKEFERKVKEIYPRWYVKSRSLIAMTDAGIHQCDEPIQVWERPIARGFGFSSDSMVMEIKGAISPNHLKKLKQGHWYRQQDMQKQIFDLCREESNEQAKRTSNMTSYETKQYVMEHRKAFREAGRRLGLSRGSVRGMGGN